MPIATDPTGWMNNPSPAGGTFQAQANAAQAQVQADVQNAGTEAWAAALNSMPSAVTSALGLAAKDVAMIIADAAGGAIIASSDAVVSALSTLGIATAAGADLGPYGAAVGAAVGVVVAVATLPQAGGSGPVPTPPAEQLADTYMTGVGAGNLVGWYWNVNKIATQPSFPQGNCFGCVNLAADRESTARAYQDHMLPYLPFGNTDQARALADNAMARMPPPQLMVQLQAANTVAFSLHNGWPAPQWLELAPGSSVQIDSIFAASAMTGASPQTMVALCKSLEQAFATGYLGGQGGPYDGFNDPRIPVLQFIESYYGTATFQGFGPPQPIHIPPGLHIGPLPPSGIKGSGSPQTTTSTATKVAYGVGGTTAAVVGGSLIYDLVMKQAMGTALKKGWGAVKRAVGRRR